MRKYMQNSVKIIDTTIDLNSKKISFKEELDRINKEAEEAVRLAEEKKAKLEAEEAETRKLIEEIKARQEAAKK